MEKLTGIKDLIKKSWKLIFTNELLGFMVKADLATMLMGIVFMIPLIIGVFTMIGSFSSLSSTTVPLPNETINVLPENQEPLPMPGPFSWVLLLLGVIFLLGYSFFYVNMAINISLHIGKENTAPIKTLITQAWKQSPTMFLHMVIKGFILLVGYMLFIIPGIIFSVKFMFSEYALVGENLGPIQALKRSSFLTKGYKWNLYIKLVCIFLIQIGLLLPIYIIMSTAGTLATIVYYTLLQVIFVLLYKDLVRIKDNQSQNTTASL